MVPFLTKLNAFEVFQLLPKTNCKKCGESGCMAFAVKLLGRQIKLEKCTPLFEEKAYEKQLKKLQERLTPLSEALETGIILEEEKCIGCGNCMIVCPVNIAENPESSAGIGAAPEKEENVIYVVKDGKAKIIDLTKCRRYAETEKLSYAQCRVCEIYCFTEAIKILI